LYLYLGILLQIPIFVLRRKVKYILHRWLKRTDLFFCFSFVRPGPNSKSSLWRWSTSVICFSKNETVSRRTGPRGIATSIYIAEKGTLWLGSTSRDARVRRFVFAHRDSQFLYLSSLSSSFALFLPSFSRDSKK